MTDPQNPKPPENLPSSSAKIPPEINNTHTQTHTNTNFSGEKVRYPNPPDSTIPDPATLREQWKYATRQYARWYSQAWGGAILAGLSFFALGWFIKGSNPLPSLQDKSPATSSSSSSSSSSSDADANEARR